MDKRQIEDELCEKCYSTRTLLTGAFIPDAE